MKSLYLAIIALFFGTGFGFLLAVSSNAQLEGHDHNDPAAHGAGTGHLAHDMPHDTTAGAMTGHDHSAMLDVTGDATGTPDLSLELHHDGGTSYNLQVRYQNFTLTPEAVNGPHVPGTGHAHIYIDGAKLTRLYSNWFLLSNLTPGAEVKVTLNANSHEQLMHSGKMVEAVITVPAAQN